VLQFLRLAALSTLLTLISGCGSTIGMRWQAVDQSNSPLYHQARAAVFSRCRHGSFMSDAPRCEYAVLEHRGRYLKIHDYIVKVSDQFLIARPEFTQWVKKEISYGYGSARTLEQFPFEIHVLTTSPLVLLAVPFDRKTSVCKNDDLSRFGCWQSERLDKMSYSLQFSPPVANGSFWFRPELKSSAIQAILDADRALKIPLDDSTLTLNAKNGFWQVLRN
jgi:hypothetical protein